MKFGQIAVVMLCACIVQGVVAHCPVPVPAAFDHEGTGLVNLDWTPVQVGICPVYPLQFATGDADVYGVAAELQSTWSDAVSAPRQFSHWEIVAERADVPENTKEQRGG